MTGSISGTGRTGGELRLRRAFLSLLLLLLTPLPADAVRQEALAMHKGHSRVLEPGFPIDTVAVGNEEVADVVTLSPGSILVNGKAVGATSLTLLGREPGQFRHYQVLVEHDLRLLREYLRTLDPAIRAVSDPNGDAVILKGKVASRQIVQRAVEATLRYLGTSELELTTIPGRKTDTLEAVSGGRAGNNRGTGNRASRGGNAQGQQQQWITEVGELGSSYVEKVKSATTRVINLLTTDDTFRTDVVRLQKMLREIDGRIRVEDLNGVFVLRGRVATPVELTRALVLADRFVTGDGSFDFEVIADRGGVLAGALDEDRPPPEGQLDLELRGFREVSAPVKGNLAQNLSRADIVAVADGRVLSMIRVDEQPRVEIQMKIVSIDRSQAERLGINWRITGNSVDLVNLTGRLIPEMPAASVAPDIGTGGNNTVDAGVANLISYLRLGGLDILSFVQALEENGLATTLSEPVITSVSGEESSFLVGGEIPLLNGQTNTVTNSVIGGTTTTSVNTVVFREFGIKLTVRPTVLDNGRIAITLSQTLSQPDYNTQLVLGGSAIPGFAKRSVTTYTEALDGDTWAVAGLLTSEDIEQLQGIPWLSRLPILGKLFQNKSESTSRKELMITVTARLLGDGAYAHNATTDRSAPRPAAAPSSAGGRMARATAGAKPAAPEEDTPWYRKLLQSPARPAERRRDGGWRPFGLN